MLDEGNVLKIGFSIESEYEPNTVKVTNTTQCDCTNNCYGGNCSDTCG
jgi:hypothetical protein